MMATFTHGETHMFSTEDLSLSIEALRKGNLILFPTDTVWSIGCDARNSTAVNKLKAITSNNNIEILTSSIEMMKDIAPLLHPRLETLLMFHKRPLTVMIPSNSDTNQHLLNEEGNISVRISQDEFSLQLIQQLGAPLATVFADTNKQWPDNFGSVSSDLLQKVDYVSRQGQTEKTIGTPSVMVKLEGKELSFLRE